MWQGKANYYSNFDLYHGWSFMTITVTIIIFTKVLLKLRILYDYSDFEAAIFASDGSR